MIAFSYFPTRSLLVGLVLCAASLVRAQNDSPGAVFTETNAPDGNHVLVFARNAHGELSAPESYPTGGNGTGAGLGNQGAVALSDNGQWLLAVNAGSNQVSVFSVRNDGLVLTDLAASGGQRPISVTIADNLVYVLNAGGVSGGADTINGFFLSENGKLWPIPGSARSLSGASVAPAQISFAQRGDVLIVTEKATSRVDTFAVNDDGLASTVKTIPSSGATPFGFAVSSHGFAFVSEAVSSALTSYRIGNDGTLAIVTPTLSNKQVAACWTVISKDEHYAYTANAATNNLSGYRIAHDGSLTLLDSTGITAATDRRPLDLASSQNGRFVYSLDPGAGTVVGFKMSEDGHLSRASATAGAPATATGLAAR
jgi:6-phosphogluconolactonase (cycloisomerase 2 family)